LHRVAAILLTIAGIIHLLPLPGLLGATYLERLYGVAVEDPNLLILMRHRAVMFGLVGLLLVAAAFKADLRGLAYAAGLASATSFLAIAYGVGGYNALIGRVVVADVVATACLLVAIGIDWSLRRS
jgi:hypothetical protein